MVFRLSLSLFFFLHARVFRAFLDVIKNCEFSPDRLHISFPLHSDKCIVKMFPVAARYEIYAPMFPRTKREPYARPRARCPIFKFKHEY